MDFRCYLTAFTRQRDFLYKLLPQADSGWLEIYTPNRSDSNLNKENVLMENEYIQQICINFSFRLCQVIFICG